MVYGRLVQTSNRQKHSEKLHCLKSVRIRSFSGPYFPAFGLNTERYSVSLPSVPMQENTDQKNSEHEHFLRSAISFIAYHHPEHYLVVLELGGLDHFSVSYLLPSYGVNFKIERQIMFHLLSKLKCIRV